MSNDEVIERIYLEDHRDNRLEVFSSGMKQRLKLALAIMSESKLLLLDEPLTNLDEKGKKWYLNTIEEFTLNRTIIVCSNHQKDEYAFCERAYHLNDEQ
jgi:ABC-type multidrug transport system ATPase subunit